MAISRTVQSVLLLCLLLKIASPSPTEDAKPTFSVSDDELELEYKEYMQQVMHTLNSDPEAQNSASKPKDGDILQHVSSSTRSKLDELKRLELRRLKEVHHASMALAKDKDSQGVKEGKVINRKGLPKINQSHLDLSSKDFTASDVQRIIGRLTADLAGIDALRRKEFKRQQMEKEIEFRQKMRDLPPEEQRRLIREHGEKAKAHAALNHPGSRKQLMEVWEKIDHMDPKKFDPKLLFLMHDIDGDRLLNPSEVEALFLFELDKLLSVTDVQERDEEMNRMREHVFLEIDANRDGMVSLDEFIKSSKSSTFDSNEGWKTTGDEPVFTDDELAKYEQEILKTGRV